MESELKNNYGYVQCLSMLYSLFYADHDNYPYSSTRWIIKLILISHAVIKFFTKNLVFDGSSMQICGQIS